MENPNFKQKRSLLDVLLEVFAGIGKPDLNLPMSKKNMDKKMRKKGRKWKN